MPIFHHIWQNHNVWSPPGALRPPLWRLGGPWHTNIMIWCVPMNFCILGIDFDIHHAYILSYLIKSQFFGPPRGPKTPFREAGELLTYKSHDMMCSNEFLYPWINFDIHHAYILSYLIKSQFLETPRGPKTPFMEARGPLTYKSHDMMCSNEFLYPWDRFWYTSCLYFIILYKITIFGTLGGPLGGPLDPLKRIGGPLTYKFHYIMCSNEFNYYWDQFWYTTCL